MFFDPNRVLCPELFRLLEQELIARNPMRVLRYKDLKNHLCSWYIITVTSYGLKSRPTPDLNSTPFTLTRWRYKIPA